MGKDERMNCAPGGLESRGWAGWLISRMRGGTRPEARLALLERITLAPRQTLALVEAEGRRFLVASSTDGAPAIYPLDGQAECSAEMDQESARPARASW
ncbi:MAG TPA: flagellar biosynthetic protein FliO [Terracidiphilus sp.]|nr:flagellar biosynthetic protein FliO [Terracidiphilus sp.]